MGAISASRFRYREAKKNLCRGGRSQDLPDTDFQLAIRQLKYVRIDRGDAEVHQKSHVHVFYVTWCLIFSLLLQWSDAGRCRRDLWSRSDADISQVLSRSSGVAVPSRSSQSSAPIGSFWKRFSWLCKGVRRLLWSSHLHGRPSFFAASVSSTAGRRFSAAGQVFPES